MRNLLVLVLGAGLGALAQEVVRHPGFTLSGNDWAQWPRMDKLTYAMGVSDGLDVAAVECRTRECDFARWFPACSAGMSSGQLADIMNKFLVEHPELRHYKLNTLVFRAWWEACNPPTRLPTERN